MSDEPVRIRQVNTIEEAELIVAWLDECDVEATVMGRQNPGAAAFGIADFEGIGIFVSDATIASRAKQLLAEHDAQRAPSSEGESVDTCVKVPCDECGHVSTFEDVEPGTVQTCAACGAFLDIPNDVASA